MKKNALFSLIVMAFTSLPCVLVMGQGKPEILYYKFNDTGRSVKNLASSPPTGTQTGYVYGGLSIGSSGACASKTLVGSGGTSNTDYFDTRWPITTSGSWTISFYTNNIQNTTTLYYLFSDITAGSLRCFTGGVAGAGNWIIRGGFTDVLITGGASTSAAVNTFVYDATAGFIYAYLNGNLVNSVAQSAITISSSGTLILSGYNSLNGLTTGGMLDEFRFYSRALSANEVARLLYTGSTTGSSTIASCGSSYKSPSGKYTWTQNGTYLDTIPNYANCDSFMSLKLDFTSNTSSTIYPVQCDNYLSPSKKVIWTKTGVYTDIIKNKRGCDSLITINLTIKNSTSSLLKPIVCGNYQSPSGKYTWTKSGKYYDTIPNKIGCDSLITIELTRGYANDSTIWVKACNAYNSPSGKYTWTTSGKYVDQLINSRGCDSTLTIHLTVGKKSSSIITEKVCNKYTSPSGKTDWVTSGTYLDTIPNKSGCDSTMTITLILNKSTFEQIFPKSCGKYTSPSGKYTFTSSTSFFDTIPNKAGCDSIMLIDLKVNKSIPQTISRTVCKKYLSPSKKHIWYISGKFSDTLSSKKGCDSVILTINLTINAATVAVTQKNARLTALADAAQYQWLDCNTNYSIIFGETNQVFTAKALGRYAVEITENACTDTSICFDVTNLKIEQGILSQHLSVLPNPNSGLCTVISSIPLTNAKVKLYNSLGQTVLEQPNLNGLHFMLDLQSEPNGIYWIELTENNRSGRLKLVKY